MAARYGAHHLGRFSQSRWRWAYTPHLYSGSAREKGTFWRQSCQVGSSLFIALLVSRPSASHDSCPCLSFFACLAAACLSQHTGSYKRKAANGENANAGLQAERGVADTKASCSCSSQQVSSKPRPLLNCSTKASQTWTYSACRGT